MTVLAIHNNTGYLNKSNVWSCADSHHYLSESMPFPPNNGVIHNVAKIIKVVML